MHADSERVQYGALAGRSYAKPGSTDPGSKPDYTFRDRSVWAFSSSANACYLPSEAPGSTPPPVTGRCWTFLDSSTGRFVLQAEQSAAT